ncbi:hypothetical protein [Amycolatopsis sp. NPDC051903]|uniref:hypothetical protein n=1 Tax=Amycolatopsis sp. NPDC051903 TaxID=3363936 RepID=UPI00379D5730
MSRIEPKSRLAAGLRSPPAQQRLTSRTHDTREADARLVPQRLLEVARTERSVMMAVTDDRVREVLPVGRLCR